MEARPKAKIKAQAKTSARTNSRRASLIKILLIFFVLLIFPIAWRWTPLSEWVNFETVIAWQQSVKNNSAAFYFVVGAYLVGSLILFPVTILNVATVFTFGPLLGNVYALAGWLASAAMGYGIGRVIGREPVQKLARSWLDRLMQPVGRHGFLTVLTMRVFPVAPFTLVNFFVGASGIRFWDFFLASLIGRIPGIIVLTVAGVQVENFLRRPAMAGLILLAVTLVLAPIATRWICKRVASGGRRRQETSKSRSDAVEPKIKDIP